ncbi:MAG TPA: hypothetical protein VLB44_10390 [Kofleriaceae bacterium]|nr:hypothetical protein [Kofleriaceae bacterium]
MIRRAVWTVVALTACGSDGTQTIDAAIDAPTNDGRIHVEDGTPTRLPCTSTFGTALTASATFGRLDGYLVAIVAPSSSSACNADSSHVHLQVKMNGAIYDVAIDVTNSMTNVDDVETTTRDMAMPVNLPWAEGWHTGLLADYVSLGVHSPDLQLQTKAQLTTTLQTDLANANHISIYGTTYGSDGAHLIHRNGGGHDGVIVTDPQSVPAHLRFFSFTDQAF